MMHRLVGSAWPLCVAAAMLFLLPACDSNSPEPVVLPPKTISFEYPQFSADDVQDGTLSLTSENQEDLESELRADGFSRDEVLEATVTDVELIRRSVGTGAGAEPLDPKVFGFLVDGEVELTGSNGSPLTIGQKSSFDPNSVVTPMNIVSSDATAFVASSTSFGSRLNLTISDIGSGDFRLGVRVTFRVEVEGV